MTSSENHEAQFTAMIRERLSMFRGLARRILDEPADVDDAVQTALLKAWQRPADLSRGSQADQLGGTHCHQRILQPPTSKPTRNPNPPGRHCGASART